MFKQILREMLVHEMGFDRIPYDDALNSLKEIQKELESHQTDIDWNFVRLHFGTMVQLKKNSCFFYDVFLYVLRLFDVYRCRDFSVIADTFQLESFVFEYSSNSFRKAKMMTETMIKSQKCCEIDGLNFVAKLLKMPYKTLPLPFELMYDVIQMHVISVEDTTLKYLLEYGIMYIPLNDHRSTWTHCRQRMSILLDDSDRKLLLNSRTIQANFKELSSESRQRMLAVFRGVEVILKASVPENCAIDFGLCFRMAYETIPEPIITSHEVAAFLKRVLSGPSVESSIEKICKNYEKLFPESCEPLAPRSMKHLSRCQVRQNLRQAGNFPAGISDLVCPPSIQNYIRSVENDYIWEQYNSYKS